MKRDTSVLAFVESMLFVVTPREMNAASLASSARLLVLLKPLPLKQRSARMVLVEPRDTISK
jgi:hypothetical protein